MSNHRRSTSISQLRLSQPLPSLPLNDISPQVSNALQPSYLDVAEEDEGDEPSPLPSPPTEQSQPQPPDYEPMHDYLRKQQRPTIHPPQYECTNERISLPPLEPYQDEPFIVTIEASQPPPPSYDELCEEHQQELQRLIRQFDMDESPAELSEDVMKWVVAMLLICLTVACVGTAFNWGRPSCNWP